MEEIQVTARLTVHEGKLEEFKKLAVACMRSVRESDTGTLQYDWFFNDDQTECVVRETYKDSAAVFEHVANLDANLGPMPPICDTTIEVFGSLSAELREAIAGKSIKVYSPFQRI